MDPMGTPVSTVNVTDREPPIGTACFLLDGCKVIQSMAAAEQSEEDG